MGKYSTKILKCINNININDNINDNINENNIDKIKTTIDDLNLEHTIDTQIIKSNCKNNKYPLLYLTHYSNITFMDFLKQYRLKQIKQKPVEHNKHFDSNFIDLLYNNNFISPDIQHLAEISDMVLKIYTFNNGLKLFIYNILDNHNHKPELNIEYIIKLCYIVRNLSKYKQFPKIIIFNCFQRKQFTKFYNDNILSSENINSGACLPLNYIYIYRNEEFYKVLTHELVHFYKLDKYFPNNKLDNIRKKYCIEYNLDIPNEAYTETFAIIIYNSFISNILNKDFNLLICNEIKFSLLQVKKILEFFKLKSLKEIYNTKCQKKIIVTTSVISYFILKTVMLLNINHFCNDFNYILNNIDSIINDLDNILETIDTSKLNGFVADTLRMTCNEL